MYNNSMQKYWILFRVKVDEYLAYRLNFILWRVRSIFNLTLLYFLWSSVLENTVSIQGYTELHIFTYIFLANIVGAIVLSSKTDQIAGDILSGAIINQLLKPMNFFAYIGTREVADKLINLFFSILEVLLFVAVLHPPLLIQTNIVSLLLAVSFLCAGVVVSFLIALSLSLIAFWSTEVWAPRFIFFVLISLTAGSMFPIDILPDWLYYPILMTPFPYMIYVPVKIYLFGISPDIVLYAGVICFWIIAMYAVATALWQRGMKEFSFFGR